MKFATLNTGSPDGRLHIVSRDMRRASPAKSAKTMQEALENWSRIEAELTAEYEAINAGDGTPFDPKEALAPLPRAWQWLDASAYASHAALMEKVFNIKAEHPDGNPLMYQGMSDRFLAHGDDVVLPSEQDGIDFEGEFGVLLDHVPMGTSAQKAREHIRLIVQINDWSLRALAPGEMKTGFGWLHSKPACSMAPIAVTPDELGASWRDCRPDLTLTVEWNGEYFGAANGYPMSVGFDELVAHAAYSRDLVAGTVIGSGTVSNENYRDVGSSCIAERRGIELLDHGEPRTGFMAFGDRVRMQAGLSDGTAPFGAIDQQVVKGGT